MPKTKNKKKQLPEEWKHANEFFTGFDPKSSDEYLWKLLRLALTSIHDMSTPEERSALISYFDETKQFINAGYKAFQRVKKQHGIKSFP